MGAAELHRDLSFTCDGLAPQRTRRKMSLPRSRRKENAKQKTTDQSVGSALASVSFGNRTASVRRASSSWCRVRHQPVRLRPITKRLVERSDAKKISERRRFDVHTLAIPLRPAIRFPQCEPLGQDCPLPRSDLSLWRSLALYHEMLAEVAVVEIDDGGNIVRH